MEMTMTITVPVEVSRDALAMWVATMLNVPVLEPTGCEDEHRADMELLDSMDDEVFVTWDEVEPKA